MAAPDRSLSLSSDLLSLSALRGSPFFDHKKTLGIADLGLLCFGCNFTLPLP